jgi:uncharacterized protein (DUF1330 family)
VPVSRSLAGFLGFLLLLLIIGLLGTWYMGPNLVRLAFDEERRNEPYYLLNFAAGERDREYQSTYRAGLAELVVADGGQLLWQAKTAALSEGRVEDEWQDVQLFEFPRAGDFVEMLTSSRYRSIVDEHPSVVRMMLGTSQGPDALATGQATVLSLLTATSEVDGSDAVIGQLFNNLSAYDGSLLWDAQVEDLEDQQSLNRVLMLTFPTLQQAEDWLRDPATVTERALTAAAAKRRVTLVLSSGS